MGQHDHLIVDGYNLIHADDQLKALLNENMEAARDTLVLMVEEYCSREGKTAEVVFDAGGRPGPASSVERSKLLTVTYTASGETADTYIEKLAYTLSRRVTRPAERNDISEEDTGGDGPATEERRPARRAVISTMLVSGDYDQQKVATGVGLLRISSREFLLEMKASREMSQEGYIRRGVRKKRVPIGERIPEEVQRALDRFRKQG